MRLRLRLLLLMIASFFRNRLSLADENVLQLRVLPNDVDITRLSSDRYLPLMDLGRINIVLRAGLLKTLLANRWVPLARVVTIRFRHPLRIFQKFQLRSRVIYWDDEWVWTEHHFERNGRTTAVGMTKVTFIGPDGMVPVSKVIAAAGESIASRPLPKFIAELQSVEEQIRERQR
jgi:acyl-CoA thioesterase FadM